MDLSALTAIMPVITKYQDVDVKSAKFIVEKYDDGVVLQILSDTPQVADMLSELMLLIAKMGNDKDKDIGIEVVNHRTNQWS